MKKTILAAAIPALLATSVNAVELLNQDGNRLQMLGEIKVSALQEEETDIEISPSAEMLFLVDSQINDDLSLGGFAKIKINTAEDSVTDGVIDAEEDEWSTVSADDMFLTFRGSWGEFSFGKQALMMDFYNVAEESHGIVDGPVMKNIISPNHEASFRYMYRAPNYNLGVSYGLEEEQSEPNIWEIGGDVTFGDLNIQAVYADATTLYGTPPVDAELMDGDTAQTFYALVAKYKMDNMVLGFGFNSLDTDGNDDSSDAKTFSIRYNLKPELSLFGGYEQISVGSANSDYMYAGIDYDMSRNVATFIELGNSDDAETVEVGVALRF